MDQTEYQQIAVGFRTEQALQKAKGALQAKNFHKVETEIESPLEDEAPAERSAKSGVSKAALAGGLMGAMVGAIIALVTFSIPNLSSVRDSYNQLLIFLPLGGAVVGAAASAVLTFMSGAEPSKSTSTTYYKITVETLPEETQQATEILLKEGGYLL